MMTRRTLEDLCRSVGAPALGEATRGARADEHAWPNVPGLELLEVARLDRGWWCWGDEVALSTRWPASPWGRYRLSIPGVGVPCAPPSSRIM
jgi:hypothetical protein